MQIRFLDVSREGIFLLGYRLILSPTEEKILRAISQGGKSNTEELCRLLPKGVGAGNVAVHINSINTKARKISGRKLIIYENGQYNVNPLM